MTAFRHDWAKDDKGMDVCARCGGLAVVVGGNTACPVPPAREAPRTAAEMLDRALGESPWERLDRRFKGGRSC